MPRTRTTAPPVSTETGQQSITYPLYLDRIPIPFPRMQEEWIMANQWRGIVKAQPICMDCREFLISNILDLDWKIEPRVSTERDELKTEIEYYTNLINQHNEYDYTHLIEWVCEDLLDLPMGAVMELGREGNNPNGRVLWYELLDGATCFPTLNNNYPVGQTYLDKTVYFKAHKVNRTYYSPDTRIWKRGWGMSPPMKVWLALELINKGDNYYASLLNDTPPTGILDLIDMEKESAEKWVQAWQALLTGIDPYKIPVLYEHEKKAEWISFSKSPTEIMFDVAHNMYASLVASSYGVSLSDIGLGGNKSNGGETLSGTIRNERKTRRTGIARLAKKLKLFFDRMLPRNLQFTWIDLDEETSVAIGRARLAASTAAGAYISNKIFTPGEMRLQTIADGLITISVPEKVPDDSEFPQAQQQQDYAERPSMMGRQVSPSSGGFGEVAARSGIETLDNYIDQFRQYDSVQLRKMMYKVQPIILEEVKGVIETLEDDYVPLWADWYEQIILGDMREDTSIPELDMTVNNLVMESLVKDNITLPEIDDVCRSVRYFAITAMEKLVEVENNHRIIRNQSLVNPKFDFPGDEIDKAVQEGLNKIPDYIRKSVITATRRYLVLNSDRNSDAERIVIDGEVSKLAYFYLNKSLDKLVGEINKNLSDIIAEVVKGAINESTSEQS